MTAATCFPIIKLLPEGDEAPLRDDDLVDAYALPDQRRSLRVNFVASIDGAVAVDGFSAGLGSPSDKRVFDLLRLMSHAVMVGAGTLLHEGYGPLVLPPGDVSWRLAHGLSAHPPLVIVSGALSVDPGHPMLTEAPVRPFVLTHAASPIAQREALGTVADVLVFGEHHIDFRLALDVLAERGMPHVLSEGGPFLLGALTAADVVDELCLTISPLLAGPGAGRITAGLPSERRDLSLLHVLAAGSELLLKYGRWRHSGQ